MVEKKDVKGTLAEGEMESGTVEERSHRFAFLKRKGVLFRLLILILVLIGVYMGLRFLGIFDHTSETAPVAGKTGAQSESAFKPQPVESAEPGDQKAEAPSKPELEGVRFTRALIRSMEYELEERRFGWRPNSFLFGKMHLTDNINNLQLGVLETVRVVGLVLKEKISRFGDSDAFDPRIEHSLNLLMISANQFWFPAADDQYRDALKQLDQYQRDLEKGVVHFYPRSDNFEALIFSCKELLGNCHYNLVKEVEGDGSLVSTFVSDDYFYYAKGVALAMSQILEATLHDFKEEVTLIKGTKLLSQVVTALNVAAVLDPWIILNGDLNGFVANHRANMAVPLGEALFKLNNILRYGGGGGG
ncbi:MAG: DUF2333 family protein [Deltaproteobacteria bacterium]|nr:DUF2333 family protein [Deltaproteobacteria bacterium]